MTKEELGRLYPIRLVPYDPGWNALFEKEKYFLSDVLGPNALRIEHAGSTAVPGIMAKPTIDILVEIPSGPGVNEKIVKIMVAAGYIHMEEQAKHLMFVKGYSKAGLEKESFHVHIGPKEQDFVWDRLYFRDYLRANPAVAKEYEQLKIALASKYPNDREAYTDSKADFIEKITALAKAAGCPPSGTERI